MSIRSRAFRRHMSRRSLMAGVASGAAVAAVGRHGRLPVLAQDATPAAACAEPIDPARLETVTMVTDGSDITVAIVPKGVHPFFEDCRIGAEEEANTLGGVTFEWQAPQQFDAAVQVRMIEDLITKGVNAIVISPNDPASVVDVINSGLEQGVLMLTFDSDSPDSNRVMYIGTDNKTAGMVQGDTLREALGGSGKIGIITGGLAALNLNERIEGLRETIGPDIEVVEVVATDEDLAKGLSVSEALLRAHPDLDGIACMSATGGPTLAQVIQGPEFSELRPVIVAFDDLQEVLDAIEADIIYATMVQRPVQMGRLSISESKRILTEGYVPECALLDTGVTVVTKENLTTYTK